MSSQQIDRVVDIRQSLREILPPPRAVQEETVLEMERLALIGQQTVELAHEARNALQELAARHDLLASQVQDKPWLLNLIEGARQAEHYLRRLFDDLRCHAGRIVLRRESLDLAALWRAAWNAVIARVPQRRVELVEKFDAADHQLEGDAFRLEQVFRNLFENTLDACPDPVRVDVHCCRIMHEGVSALRVAVRDNGPGFPPAQRPHIFQPFYTTRRKGTGLGLAISRRIVEAHDGLMKLGDASGGAELIVVLPRDKKWKNCD